MLLLPFELAGELLLPAAAAAAAASVDVGAADGVRSLLLANKLGGLSGAVELMEVAEEEEQPPVVLLLMMLLMLLLSNDSRGFTGLLLFTDFSLSCADESSDLAIFCKVGQRISQYGNEANGECGEGTSIRA